MGLLSSENRGHHPLGIYMSDTQKHWTEELKVSGENLLSEIERLIHEGNVNHVVVKNTEGHTIIEFPVNVGLIGLVLVPILAAVAAIATYAAHFTVIVTRSEPPPVV
jgi:hypothetical protein